MTAHTTRITITETEEGALEVRSLDLFDRFRIYRLEREAVEAAPTSGGVYVLFGNPDGTFTAYIGQSTTSIRARVKQHAREKAWFTTAFAIPLPHASLSRAVEAELINLAETAKSVKVLENNKSEAAYLASEEEVQEVQPIVDRITSWLALLTGTSIFDPPPTEKGAKGKRAENLAREYKGQASRSRPVQSDDPAKATHSYVGAAIAAWGRFTGGKDDKRFAVLKGSEWREPVVDRSLTTFKGNKGLGETQRKLVKSGVLDPKTMTFSKDHAFANWNKAVQAVSGCSQYSGSRSWQKIDRPRGLAAKKR